MPVPAIGIALPAAPALPATPALQPGQGGAATGKGFGSALSDELTKLEATQQQATTATQQLVTGQATDISSVAMQVEQASLSLQLAVQVRNKVVDAYQELFRMQV